ncbi:primosomal protein N' [Pueribacillus theae]|uniref:Replication restart protein PriA n=1 Tax=Pueribacillus theae TaxID=2171751 RepID=A0A2U1K8H3_9BACI|nr:primosomal protein N' [Pueribacillus theae]PWA13458.1 primosomal protein N' [Pueribacillus theae]
MIAKVIVDVANSKTDRSYDYLIPDEWTSFIEKGMRVIVPFNNRNVQGFVVDLEEHSTVPNLKKIKKFVDMSPVLTGELLDLGFWLSEAALCFKITALQAMLPVALKARYKKQLERVQADMLPKEVNDLFQKNDLIDWDEVIKLPAGLLKQIQKLIKAGAMKMVTEIKDRTTSKTIKVVKPAMGKNDLLKEIETLTPRAKKQKEILEWFLVHFAEIPSNELLMKLHATRSTLKALINKQILVENDRKIYRDPYEAASFKQTEPLALTDIQQKAIQPILSSVENSEQEIFLLHGVTGSGKTEIYLQSIQSVLEKGKEAIMLVPEISLTPQIVQRFKERFGSDVAVLHSGLSAGEKYDEWLKIHRKEVKVVVGARSAIFAPFENIGMIIIDEEHESSYKQEENPRYHARDVAEWRSKYHQCPLILGSATPSLESYARSQKNVYHLSELTERIHSQSMPEVMIVDMREELREGNRSIFSRILIEKIKEKLDRKEQCVLFLNRRGYSTFIMCRDCGYVAECPHCDISLTYHKNKNTLKCHYCGFEEMAPNRCPDCGSQHIRFFGTGTQKVEEELTKLMPEARIIRMDVDTTSRKGAHEKLLSAFANKQGDILLGTQMIAKGLDFPDVTLVGVIAADTMLNLPDFRAAERTFQLLTQVSGRAGRHKLQGEVIVQSYNPEHYSIQLASGHNYTSFYLTEMKARKAHAYPPYYYLTLITVSHPELMKVIAVAEKITSRLKKELSNKAIVLGPAASVIPRIKDRYRYQCMIKYKNEPNLFHALKSILNQYENELGNSGLQIVIDSNPYMLM